MIRVIFYFIYFISNNLWAQDLEEQNPKERHWYVGSGIQTQSMSFSLSDRIKESSTNTSDPDAVRYEPNVGQRIYLYAGYKDFSVYYAFSTSPEEETIAQKGESKQTDYGFSFNTEHWLVDTYFKDYTGFFVESGRQTPTLRPDLSSKLIGLSFLHSLDPSYSLKPLYSFEWSGEQMGSGYIVGLNLNHFNFSADSPVLSRNGFLNLKQHLLSAAGGVSGFQSKTNYLYGGSATVSLGPEYHSVNYQTTTIRNDSGLGYAFGFHLSAAAAYKWTALMLGGRFKGNFLSTYIGDTGIQASGFDFDVFTTYSF